MLLAVEHLKEPGVMLRVGTWNGDVGSFVVPAALANIKSSAWPIDGWIRLNLRADRIELEPVLMPNQQSPAFLKTITRQLEDTQDQGGGTSNQAQSNPAQQATSVEPSNDIFVRVPGAKWVTGSAQTYRFKNGTGVLRPKLDNRYELVWAGQPFAFTVQNGLRDRNGRAYGDGAQYTIEYDGNKYEYSLGEFGWDSQIMAIADLDGDGKPDFIITVGGNNSGYEAILLSSRAKPGKNPPTASLRAIGC